MGDTFSGIAREVKLRVPLAPIFLVESWVRESFRRAWEYRKPAWSMARREDGFQVNAQKTGTVDVTNGSAIVTGVGLSFAASDEGRQFRVGANTPVYSIASVSAVNNTAELDRVYRGTTDAAADGKVLDAYVTMPADFGKFLVVIDPANFWQLRHWITDDRLNRWDPQRSSTTTPWALVSRRESTLNGTKGRKQYELWPYATSQHEYWMFYARRAPDLSEDEEFPGLLGDRGDIVRQGALSLAAEWPGTEERKNPYFNLALSKQLRADYELELARLEVNDEDVYPTWWEHVSWVEDSFSPLDSRFLQSHDV